MIRAEIVGDALAEPADGEGRREQEAEIEKDRGTDWTNGGYAIKIDGGYAIEIEEIADVDRQQTDIAD
jgi:hypothetical protein